MRSVNAFEIGLMFWATGDAEQEVQTVLDFGLRAGQLGIGGEAELARVEEGWKATLVRHPEFAIATAVCAYEGEDYADISTVRRTVGFAPRDTCRERVERTKDVANVAARLGIRSVACHIGFVPEDSSDPIYVNLCSIVREVCDCAARNGQTFALETGQEPAGLLLQFLRDVARPNLKINFDPANLILYGMGDPIAALRLLSEHVVSVHCKDGVAPESHQSGLLGRETRLGSGEVDFDAFLTTLASAGYRGILSIERETPDAVVRQADIRHAVHLLRELVGKRI